MSSPLLSSILGSLDPRTIGDLASRNGISEGALSKSVEPLAAALLTGAATKASSPGVATQLFSLVSGPASEDAGSKLISTVFGNNTSAVADTLGRATGLSSGAVGPALTLLAPALLAGVGKLVRDRGVSASAFSGLLSNEASAVKGVLPAGVSTLFGSTAPAPEVLRTVRETVSPVAVATVREDKKGISPWLWLLPLLLIGGLLWWAFGRHKEEPVKSAEAGPCMVRDLGDMVSTTLPGGVDIKVHKNGVENQVLAFVTNSSKQVDETTWADFDRLLFDTDSATLKPESQDQISNIAAIMKAYPNLKLKIGGYTDNTGEAAHNLKLSQDRADGVVKSLVALGIPADRLESQGYGEEHAIAPNTTEECRALNRRIAISVRAK